MFSPTLDLRTFLVSALVVVVLVKLISLLPARYYFQFSGLVDQESQTQFLTRPELPSPQAYCFAVAQQENDDTKKTPANISTACDQLNGADSILVPSDARVDGEFLFDNEYRKLVQTVVERIKAKAGDIRRELATYGAPYRNRIDQLANARIEQVLFGNGSPNLFNIVNFASGEHEKSQDVAAKLKTADPELDELLTKLDEAYAKTVSSDGDSKHSELIKRYRDAQLKPQVDLIRSEIIKQDRFLFWPALLVKLAPPFIAGFLVALFFPLRAIYDAPIAAGVVAFMLCWPVVVLWDVAVAHEWKSYRYLFFALYVAYILSYYFAARLGCLLAFKSPNFKAPDAFQSLDWNKVFATALTTLVTSGATAAITWTVTLGK